MDDNTKKVVDNYVDRVIEKEKKKENFIIVDKIVYKDRPVETKVVNRDVATKKVDDDVINYFYLIFILGCPKFWK